MDEDTRRHFLQSPPDCGCSGCWLLRQNAVTPSVADALSQDFG